MKKRLLVILCCAVMAFGLCACGGTDSGSKGGNDDTEETETQEEENDEWKEAYEEVLADVVAEDGEYAFDQAEHGKLEDYAHIETAGYQYTLYDVDVDGIPELFVEFYRGSDVYAPIRVFTYENGEVKEFEKEFSEGIAYGPQTSEEYKGIMSFSFGRMNGISYYAVYEIIEGEFVKVDSMEYTYDQTQDPKYEDAWTAIEWTKADDLSVIKNYDPKSIEEKISIVEEVTE